MFTETGPRSTSKRRTPPVKQTVFMPIYLQEYGFKVPAPITGKEALTK